jgi:DNA-binding transcriptional MerR regulator
MAGGAATRVWSAGGITIGALAERTGVTAEAIRYYERVGVLPRPTRGAAAHAHAGYRRYGAADVERLSFVRRARDLGFSLDEVRDLLSLAGDPGRPCADVDRMARAHLEHVEAKIARLSALRTELRRVIGACRGGLAVADCQILRALSDAAEPSTLDTAPTEPSRLGSATARGAPLPQARP